VIFRAATTEN